eukprot:358081-Chlamydomonas_euryale.AAC.3
MHAPHTVVARRAAEPPRDAGAASVPRRWRSQRRRRRRASRAQDAAPARPQGGPGGSVRCAYAVGNKAGGSARCVTPPQETFRGGGAAHTNEGLLRGQAVALASLAGPCAQRVFVPQGGYSNRCRVAQCMTHVQDALCQLSASD